MTGKLPDPENHAAKGFGPPHSWVLRNRRSITRLPFFGPPNSCSVSLREGGAGLSVMNEY
jgi:hypothetical protein